MLYRIKQSEWRAAQQVEIDSSSIGKIVIKPIANSGFFEFFGMKFSKAATSCEQVVILVGKNCTVGSISFAKSCQGKVILKEGASVSGEISEGVLVSS